MQWCMLVDTVQRMNPHRHACHIRLFFKQTHLQPLKSNSGDCILNATNQGWVRPYRCTFADVSMLQQCTARDSTGCGHRRRLIDVAYMFDDNGLVVIFQSVYNISAYQRHHHKVAPRNYPSPDGHTMNATIVSPTDGTMAYHRH